MLGKLPQDLLAQLLHKYCQPDSRVIVGPKVGEDATVIDFGETLLVVKTDPITFVTEDIGWYVINVNANDIATMGAVPRWFLATVLLPPEGSPGLAEEIFSSIYRAASALGISLCGGHTEFTAGLDRPIVAGQMVGEVKKEQLVCSSGAKPGDEILLTKGLAVEATSIIAREKDKDLLSLYGRKFVERCRNFLYDPGISVLREARLACQTAKVHAMHDPTEGGVATALHELAKASDVGLEIDGDQLFIREESRELCQRFGLDPSGVISSGALLIVVAKEDGQKVRKEIQKAGIECHRIGRVKEKSFGLKIKREGRFEKLPSFPRDEIIKLFCE
ncbi:MAG: hydrogenase expression/formation protein [Candidatus Latescibacterota bacterium]|nr:MAG: hydrogenase expression/formation protein [Candidatus Latescibacterota bacterium]